MKRILLVIWAVVLWMLLAGCASVKLGSISRPVETSRLRVVVVPVSDQLSRGKWGKSSEEFASSLYRTTSKLLARRGYYEVVPEVEVKEVLGEYIPDHWRLTRNDAELTRQIGAALYADYVLLAERGTLGEPHYYFEVTLINIDSGQRFSVRINNIRERGGKKLPDGTGKQALRELFRDAKGDLLATALHKTRGEKSREIEQRPVPEEVERSERERQTGIQTDLKKPVSVDTAPVSSRNVEYVDAEKDEGQQSSGAKRLIVNDLATTSEAYRPAALILSEALREEIQKHGDYNLLNRENIQQLFDEMKFQQSGLVDSAQAVQLGKSAGAQEIVTGNLGALGRTVVMQSKRTELETMINLSQASLKSEAGQEDQLLLGLVDMVEQLLQNKK